MFASSMLQSLGNSIGGNAASLSVVAKLLPKLTDQCCIIGGVLEATAADLEGGAAWFACPLVFQVNGIATWLHNVRLARDVAVIGGWVSVEGLSLVEASFLPCKIH